MNSLDILNAINNLSPKAKDLITKIMEIKAQGREPTIFEQIEMAAHTPMEAALEAGEFLEKVNQEE